MGCLNLSQKKLRIVQGKMLNGESLVDGRGMHENRKVKLTDQVKQLIQEHCLTKAHQKSHYLRESTKLNYFTKTELNLAKLFSEFCDYYISTTLIYMYLHVSYFRGKYQKRSKYCVQFCQSCNTTRI